MLAFENSPPADLRAIEANELARRAHGGCADAFTELSRRYRPRLLHLVEPRLGGRLVDAEDVAQEALARAFQRLDQFDPRYQFSTWLYTIAIRLAHDHAKRRRTLDKDLEFLRSISPIYKVDRIVAPLFVLQGKNDPRVPYTESEQIVKALRDRNRPVEYILFEDEGHGFVKLNNRLVMYPKIVEFLDKHMK